MKQALKFAIETTKIIIIRLIVGSDFGSNFWNRLDPTVSTLEIDPKSESVSNILKSNRSDSTRFSISILEIESIFGFKF